MSKAARWIFVFCIAASLAAAGWGIYQHLFSKYTLRVAVAERQGGTNALLNAVAQWLRNNGKFTIVELVHAPSDAAAAAEVEAGRAEAAVLRSDASLPKELSSAALLYHEFIAFVAPSGSPVKAWSDLRGKTLGLLGQMKDDDPLLRKVLGYYNVTETTFLAVAPDALNDVVAGKQVHLLVGSRPAALMQSEEGRAHLRSFKTLKGKAMLLGIDDAEVIVDADTRYGAFDIPARALKASPPLPAEETATLSFSRHLVVRSNMQGLLLQKILADLMAAKRSLTATMPIIRQMGSPGDSADAAMPVHAAALSYYAGDELSLFDMVLDWVYTVPLILGGLGAGLTWLYNMLWPAERRRARDTVIDLLVLRREAGEAKNLDELGVIQTKRDLMQDAIDKELTANIGGRTVTALLVAADAADRKLDAMDRRLAAAAGRVP